MKKSEILETVQALALPVCESCGVQLWDVEYVKEGGEWFLRVYIDKDEGINITDCEAVSIMLDPILDEADPIDGSYCFEVSSAGAERILKRPSDFEKFIGSYVCVKLYQARDGRKEIYGTLASYNDGTVVVEENGSELTFEKGQYAHVRLAIRF